MRVRFAVLMLLWVFSCARDSDSSRIHLAYVTNGVTSFWQIAKVGAEHAARDFDVEVTVRMPAEGISDQKRMVQDLLTVGIDGIAISPIDPAQSGGPGQRGGSKHQPDHTGLRRTQYQSSLLHRDGQTTWPAGCVVNSSRSRLPKVAKWRYWWAGWNRTMPRRRRQGVIDELLDRSN